MLPVLISIIEYMGALGGAYVACELVAKGIRTIRAKAEDTTNVVNAAAITDDAIEDESVSSPADEDSEKYFLDFYEQYSGGLPEVDFQFLPLTEIDFSPFGSEIWVIDTANGYELAPLPEDTFQTSDLVEDGDEPTSVFMQTSSDHFDFG